MPPRNGLFAACATAMRNAPCVLVRNGGNVLRRNVRNGGIVRNGGNGGNVRVAKGKEKDNAARR